MSPPALCGEAGQAAAESALLLALICGVGAASLHHLAPLLLAAWERYLGGYDLLLSLPIPWI